MQLLKDQQKRQIEQLQLDMERIRDNAEMLAEKYEDIGERQQVLFKRFPYIILFEIRTLSISFFLFVFSRCTDLWSWFVL